MPRDSVRIASPNGPPPADASLPTATAITASRCSFRRPAAARFLVGVRDCVRREGVGDVVGRLLRDSVVDRVTVLVREGVLLRVQLRDRDAARVVERD